MRLVVKVKTLSLLVPIGVKERGVQIKEHVLRLLYFFVSEGFNNTAHDSGKWRYETLEKAMSENPTPTKDQLRDVMKSAKYLMNDRDYMFELRKQGIDTTNPDNWDWITIWTDILNTSEKSLTLWMKENYEVENTFKLEY